MTYQRLQKNCFLCKHQLSNAINGFNIQRWGGEIMNGILKNGPLPLDIDSYLNVFAVIHKTNLFAVT